MESPFLETENPKPVRSQLLKVLCILSFVMCGLSFLQGITRVFQDTPEAKREQIEQIRQIKPDMADTMENEMIAMQENTYFKISPYVDLIYILLSFLGVFMMWNFNKKGFFLYSIAEILPYTAYLFLGNNTFSMANSIVAGGAKFALVGIVIMVLVDLIFVGLYAKCTKEMR
jgi:hypothetical protein